jgi:protocatechuate 3,4-dioxygenase beta subunit
LLVKKSLIALAAVIIIAAAWYAAAPRPTVAPLPGTRVAATSSLPAPGSNVPTEAAPEVEAPRLAGAAPESEAAEPASGEREPAMGSFRLKVLWAGDGTPAGALGVEVWPRWCETPLLCGRAGVTGDDGVLVLDGLVPGRYSFRTALGTNGRLGALKPFEVAAGEETRLVIRAEDGIHLRGIVVDAADRPVPGAAIWLAAESFDPMGGDVVSRSGPDGRFELRGVGDGGLYVSARAPGHAPSSQIVVVSRHAEEELRLVLPAAGGAVRGRVIGADGMPVEGAWVLVGAREFTSGAYVAAAPPARSRTDGGGEFAVEGIATGRTPILVRSPPHALAETAVEVAAGSVGVVTIALQAGAVFGGTVTSADGRPVEGAEVRLGKGEDEAPRSDLMFGRSDLARLGARTRAGGEFAIEGAPPGDWHVDIDAGNRGRERRTVVLTAGLETRIEVSLRPPLRLRGRVRCRDGQALAKALVVIYPGGSTEIADGSGRFAFQGLEDREYSLRISELRAGIAAIRRQGLRPTAEEIEVVVEDEERASGGIAGRVVDAGGKGVAGALLTAEYVELPGEADRARSDASGGFLFERLPAGTYRVRADVEGQPRAWASDARVAAGERIDLGTVMIPLPGFLAASVTLLDGGMKEKVYYGIVDAGGRYALAVWLSSDPVRRDPLVPGRYRLIVRAPGAGDVEREFEIEAGRETRLDVEVGKP